MTSATPLDRAGSRRFQMIREALDGRDDRRVRELARAIREDLAVHDGLVDAIAAALSCGIDVTSPEEGEEIARRAMERHIDRREGTYAVPFTTPARRPTGSPQGAHSRHCGGVALAPRRCLGLGGRRAVAFHIHPCGSGMRLELGVEAFVDSAVYPGSLGGFFDALNRGVARRNWSRVGTSAWDRDVVRHRLPVPNDPQAGTM